MEHVSSNGARTPLYRVMCVGKNSHVNKSIWHMLVNKNQITYVQTLSCSDTCWIFPNGKFPSWCKIYAKWFDGFKYLLVATCEITSFGRAISINLKYHRMRLKLWFLEWCKHLSPAKLLIVCKDSSFTEEVIQVILRTIMCQLSHQAPSISAVCEQKDRYKILAN